MMNIKAIYEEIGGDYESMLQRVYEEENIKLLLPMFLEDDSYPLFMEAMQKADYERATEEIHGLKGICSNLSLQSLYEITVDILTALRAGDVQHAKDRQEDLKQCYDKIVKILRENQ